MIDEKSGVDYEWLFPFPLKNMYLQYLFEGLGIDTTVIYAERPEIVQAQTLTSLRVSTRSNTRV
jgi:hypothetical protein